METSPSQLDLKTLDVSRLVSGVRGRQTGLTLLVSFDLCGPAETSKPSWDLMQMWLIFLVQLLVLLKVT